MELAHYIYAQIESGRLDAAEGRRLLREVVPSDIAIVGMSCEYTGAPDLFSFEKLLRSGRNGFVPFPASRRDYFPRDHHYLVDAARRTGREPEELFQAMCDQIGSYIDDVDKFDNDFFEISAKEAKYIDPMHRIILKHLYLALEHSGTTRAEVKGSRAAIYVGKDRSIAGSYATEIEQDSELINPGTWEGILASRLNYLYDLSGGSLVVDTACSSSLVAAHIAGKMLRDNEIDMALVGGIALGLAPRQGELFGDYANVETTSDHLKVFDQASSGTIFGEGAGVVVLRRLQDAIDRNDHVYAILRATGINSDGRSNGLTAPNPKAQTELIKQTYAAASISAETIDYVDAHGTGTKLGDPIEIRGLTDAFRSGGATSYGTCALSSLKENVGHTVGAAGVGGMIKMALALDSQLIFPSSSFVVPNDYIKFVDTPFYIPQDLSHWVASDHPRRGAVSSFGFSGTNGHVVLEEPKARITDPEVVRELPFVFTAPTRAQLAEAIEDFLKHRTLVEERRVLDVSYTLTRRREFHSVRLAFTASTFSEVFIALQRASTQLASGEDTDGLVEVLSPSSPAHGGEAARMLAVQYAENPSMFSLPDRLRLTAHESGDFISDFDFGDATVCGLPGFRFTKNTFWGTVKTYDIYDRPAAPLGSPVSGQLIDTRILTTPDTDIYSMTLDTSRWFLQDHRIAGESTLSGTAYAQLAAEIATLHFGEPSYELGRIMFKNLIQVKAGEVRTIYVQVASRGAGLSVEVFAGAEADDAQPYTPFASFTLRKFDPTEALDGEPVDSALFDGVAPMVMSDETGSGVFRFSGRWDLLRNKTQFVSLSETDHVIALELQEEFRSDVDVFHVSPSMLDLLAGVISWERSLAVSRQFLPLSYGRLVFTGKRLSTRSFSRTQLLYEPSADPGVASADVWVYNDSGELVVYIERYSMRAFVPRDEVLEYHEVGFEEIMLQLPPAEAVNQTVCVVGFGSRASAALATSTPGGQLNVRTAAELATERDDQYDTVVYVPMENADGAYGSSSKLVDFFNFARSISRHVVPGGNLVVLVPRGLSRDDDQNVDPIDYAILSAARVIGLENPKLNVFAISDVGLDLPTALSVAGAPELEGRRVLVEGGRVYVDKFISVQRELPARRGLPTAGVVVLTGGFGGVGTEYIDVLWHELGTAVAVLGRRSLTDLESSSNPDDQSRAARLRELVEDGLDLRFVHCDVSNKDEVQDAIESIQSGGTTISGVVHLAGAPDDGMLFRKTEEDFHRVVDAKALGAEYLLGCVDRGGLHFFIVSSSMTTITGAPGQFSYTLANAYLEGLARANKVVSVTRWPGWKETGMALAFGVSSAPDDSFLLEPLTTAAATGYVRQSITRDYTDLIAGRVTASTEEILASSVVTESATPAAHAAEPSAPRSGADMVIKDFASLSLQGIDRELDDLEKFIAVLFASVLDVTEIDVSMSFTDMGGDSMKAFSIYTPLVEQLDVDLEVADIFIYSSVLELSGHVREVQSA